MKVFLAIIAVAVCGLAGFVLEPILRPSFAAKPSSPRTDAKTTALSVAASPATPAIAVASGTINPSTLTPEQLPEKVVLKVNINVSAPGADPMVMPAGSRVKPVRVEGEELVVSPGAGPFEGKVAFSGTDLLEQLAANPPKAAPPSVTTPNPVAAPTPTPAPATTEPAPAVPAPTTTEPAPAVPSPTTTEPAPAVPAPASTEPAPAVPAPATTEPAPAVPAPASTEPAPAVPAPASTEPAPAVPAPASTEPATPAPASEPAPAPAGDANGAGTASNGAVAPRGESEPPANTATVAPSAQPAASLAPTQSDVVKLMQENVRAGTLKEFKYPQVVSWKDGGEETVAGQRYKIGLVVYQADTIFGTKQIPAKALVQDNRVVKWVLQASGNEIR